LPGRPDIFLPKHRLAVFVHGCFWHGHEGCRRAKLPDTRREFWATKIAANRSRDARTLQELAALGIASVTLWECQLKEEDAIIAKIAEVTGRGTGTDVEKTETRGR
jgi:DNA mismatch endonuclease (patch repair protein)